MSEKSPSRVRKLLIVIPLLLGIGAVVIAVKSRTPPEQETAEERVTKVRVIEAREMTVVPRALAYGNAEPGTVWNAVAEVGGEIVHTHPDLKRGALLPEGAVLYRIDPTSYELAVAQIEADIMATRAKLEELEARRTNTESILALEERALVLSKKDLERQKQLHRKNAVAQAVVDKEERNVLAQQLSVQNQRNTLNLIPAERRELEAQLQVQQAKLEDARLDLENTVIRAPFDCRVAEVNAEQGQFAAANQTLAVVDSIDVTEVSAQLPIDKMMTIVKARGPSGMDVSTAMSELTDMLGLEPVVRLQAGSYTVEWPARLSRISDTVDPKTRTVGVIVAVDHSYETMEPGYKPPLVKNMFVEVELRGRPRDGLIAVPRSALHGDHVYVADSDDRLEKRPIEILFRQTNFVVVKSGLKAGDRVLVTDLVPAVDGMKLDPVTDESAAARLAAEARAEGAVR